MSMIDQRIVIKAPMAVVWEFLTAPSLIPRWNPMCRQLFILTTKPTGVGARRRCVDIRGKARVEEITAWVENFGYEYKLIDGNFKDLKGRYRLQETQIGVQLNWTLEYQPRGAFAGLRDMFSIRGRLKRDLAGGLKRLKDNVEKSGFAPESDKLGRSAMRSAPDVNARAALAAEVIARAPQSAAKTPTTKIVIDGDNVTYLPIDLPSELPVEEGNKQELAVVPDMAPNMVASVAVPAAAPVPPIVTPAGVAEPPKAAPAVVSVRETPRGISTELPKIEPPPTELGKAEPPAISEPPPKADDTKPQRAARPVPAQTAVQNEEALAKAAELSNSERIAYAASTVSISLVAPPRQDVPRDTVNEPTQTMAMSVADIPAVDTPPGLPERVPTAPYAALNADLLSYPTPPPPLSASVVGENAANTATGARNTAINDGDTVPPEVSPNQPDGDVSIWDVFGVKSPQKRATDDLEAVISSVREPMAGIRESLEKVERADERADAQDAKRSTYEIGLELAKGTAGSGSNADQHTPPHGIVAVTPTLEMPQVASVQAGVQADMPLITFTTGQGAPSSQPITIPESPPDDDFPTGMIALQRRASVNVRSPFKPRRS